MIMPILAVKDVAASIAFYQDKLGFSVSVSMPGEDGQPNFAVLNMGDGVTVGLQLDTELAQRGDGVVLMMYVPDSTDIDGYYGQVKGRGVPIVEEINTGYWGDRLFSVKDPDGYWVSLCKTVQQMSNEEIQAAGAAQA
jgi:PhnB protein